MPMTILVTGYRSQAMWGARPSNTLVAKGESVVDSG